MKTIVLDQIRLADNRFPHTLRNNADTDNSVALQYKLDYLEVLTTLIRTEVKEGASKLPDFQHYKSEIQHLNTRSLDDNKIVRVIFENLIIGVLIEAYLMEVTSTLDITARISSKFLNASFSTFRGAGQKVLNHIKHNCGKFKNQKELIKLIEEHKKVWIDIIFELRVAVSHYENLRNLFSFHIDVNNEWDGKSFENTNLSNPKIGDLDLCEFIEFINENLSSFVTDYLRLSIDCKT